MKPQQRSRIPLDQAVFSKNKSRRNPLVVARNRTESSIPPYNNNGGQSDNVYLLHRNISVEPSTPGGSLRRNLTSGCLHRDIRDINLRMYRLTLPTHRSKHHLAIGDEPKQLAAALGSGIVPYGVQSSKYYCIDCSMPAAISRIYLVCAVLLCLPLAVLTKCLTDRVDVNPKRHLYRAGRSWSITVESSNRASHQLVSHVMKILLTEVLGYDSVTIMPDYNTQNATEILNRLSGCNNNTCDDEAVPETMLNLEVWSPAGFNMEQWVNEGNVKDAGPLGPGRYGWYMPTWIVKRSWYDRYVILDHWRSLQSRETVALFHPDDDVELIKSFLSKSDLKNMDTYCHDADCHEGILIEKRCAKSKQKCALLLSSYPEKDMGVLRRQIYNLNLDVSVTWIGSHLHSYVHHKMLQNKPVLFFNWVPNSLTAAGNFTRVPFPTCDVGRNDPGHCDFPVNQLSKLMWAKLETHAPEAYHVISKMHFSQSQYEEFLRVFVGLNPDFAEMSSYYELAACEWIRANEPLWQEWLPPILSSKTTIYLGGMFSLSGPFWRQPGLIPGVQMAVDYINSQSTILADYQLELKVVDTQCKGDIAMKQFMHLISNDTHPIAGIIGPGCSETAEPIAGVAKHFNTIVISYSAAALALNNRALFPLFLRTVPSMSQYIPVLIELFNIFKWERVALIAEDEQEFLEFKNFLKHECLDSNINVAYDRKIPRQTSVADAQKYLEELKKNEAKIIVLTSFEKSARAVMCLSLKMGLTGKNGYVWFLPSWFTHLWWNTTQFNAQYGENIPCTAAEMIQAIQGHLTLGTGFFGPDDSVIISNMTVFEWVLQYVARLEESKLSNEWSPYASYAHDAVWVFALALDKLLSEDPSALESLHTDKITRELLSHITSLEFVGVSGPLHFVGSGRTVTTKIMEFTGSDYRLVGHYIPDNEEMVLNETGLVWPGGSVPKDGRPEPKTCSLESFRAMLGIDCDDAIVTANILGLSSFGIIMLTALILVKRRYDVKVRATRERMEELGLMSDLSWRALDQWEVPRDRVVLNRKLGEGAFGTVYGGEAFIDDKWVGVAVKTLKIGSNPEEKLDFLSEAEMMKRYDHENIVKLLGVCTRGEPAYAIMEFMLHGDLKTFLVARRQLVGQNTKESEDVTPEHLTAMARDIASGLKYLTDIKFVHRDLACRNCLVHASKTVKIGDFGMARPMYDSDYYRFNKRGMLPVRWMAPESLTDGLFTAASDIWSFGVLLYEIVTFGSFPYQGMSNKQVLEAVKSGQCIQLPPHISEELHEVMTACWSFEPENRPSVDHILELLTCSPFLVQPCLDAPRTVVDLEVQDSGEMPFPPSRPRCNRLTLRPQSEHCQARSIPSNISTNAHSSATVSSEPYSGAETALPKRLSLASVFKSGFSDDGDATGGCAATNDSGDCPVAKDDRDRDAETKSDQSSLDPQAAFATPAVTCDEHADSDYCSDNSKEFAHVTTT
ncbi:hypothetical protein LSH36_590g02059 [Paralvinella palmiformis]|uniref:receptor protein-tyrosine kinase n=1 Tax=Paralvinella palmiformis TaxID=53620 RepID=A0AAD9J5T2_9ANNE|nr:hypothetical protein LSH36_590g02059 [Paralvinella palmiformis]